MKDILRRAGSEGGVKKGRPRDEEGGEIIRPPRGTFTPQEEEWFAGGGKKGRNPNRIRRWVGRK